MADMTAEGRFTDIDDLFPALSHAHPEIPDREWSRILRYTPKETSPTSWKAVRPFTIEAAARMTPVSRSVTQRLMSMTARFHLWLWTTTGAVLTLERAYTLLTSNLPFSGCGGVFGDQAVAAATGSFTTPTSSR